MREVKREKIKESIGHLAAEFLSRESNRMSLITVTGVRLNEKGDRATVAITVFPEDEERRALSFANRSAGRLREFIKNRLSIQHLPFLSFVIDVGEKNRQRLDALGSSL